MGYNLKYIDILPHLLKNEIMTKKNRSITNKILLVLLSVFISFIISCFTLILLSQFLVMLFPPAPVNCSGGSAWVPCGGFEEYTYIPQATVIGLITGILSFFIIKDKLLKR